MYGGIGYGLARVGAASLFTQDFNLILPSFEILDPYFP